MEDTQNIKKVLESQGDVHDKVANQSNSKLLSSSPTQSSGPPHIQIDVQIAYDLCFGRSTYARKAKEISFPIIKTVPISRTVFHAAPLFWPDGPCIQLEYIRDAS
jgi:hypothetical protein